MNVVKLYYCTTAAEEGPSIVIAYPFLASYIVTTSPQLYPSHGACLDCMLPGVQVATGLNFFCVQVIYVIMKIVTPCFNRPSLLSRSLVGQCTGYCRLHRFHIPVDHPVCQQLRIYIIIFILYIRRLCDETDNVRPSLVYYLFLVITHINFRGSQSKLIIQVKLHVLAILCRNAILSVTVIVKCT